MDAMKLYYTPGACSLSPHIVLREAGLDFTLERVDLATHKTATGADFTKVNPKGYVPALLLDDGEVLTEGAVIVQYLADQRPQSGLAPAGGTMARTRLQEHLNFVAAEVHKGFSPLFNSSLGDEAKQILATKLRSRLSYVDTQLLGDGRAYLMGDRFTVADAYLFTVARWTKPTGIGLADWPKLAAYVDRVAAREPVRAALKAEGLE
jgi:glutathione S-transferase